MIYLTDSFTLKLQMGLFLYKCIAIIGMGQKLCIPLWLSNNEQGFEHRGIKSFKKTTCILPFLMNFLLADVSELIVL